MIITQQIVTMPIYGKEALNICQDQGGKRLGDETSVSEQKGVMQWTGIELGARPKFKIQRSKFKMFTIY